MGYPLISIRCDKRHLDSIFKQYWKVMQKSFRENAWGQVLKVRKVTHAIVYQVLTIKSQKHGNVYLSWSSSKIWFFPYKRASFFVMHIAIFSVPAQALKNLTRFKSDLKESKCHETKVFVKVSDITHIIWCFILN